MTSTPSEMNPVKMMKMVRQSKCFIKKIAVFAESLPKHSSEPQMSVY